MEKVIKHFDSIDITQKYIYRDSGKNYINNEASSDYNDKGLYIKLEKDDISKNIFNLNFLEFPELEDADFKVAILTNDGIFAIQVNTDVIIYDLLKEDSSTFENIKTASDDATNLFFGSTISESTSENLTHYLISIKNGKIIGNKVSDSLFYIDCDSISNVMRDKLNPVYFIKGNSIEFNPENIFFIKKPNYNIKIINNYSGEDNIIYYDKESSTLKGIPETFSGIIEIW